MFGEGYLSNNLFEIVGLLVTILGIWFVVRQLREGKLSSQMEAMMGLREMISDYSGSEQIILDLFASDDWNSISDKEAHKRIVSSESTLEAWNEITSFMELYSLLVRKSALDESLAFAFNGKFVSLWWSRLERIVYQERTSMNWSGLLENWEWLARRFEGRNA